MNEQHSILYFSEVCVVSVSGLVVPVCELGVFLAVWDAAEGGVVMETAVKHLVNHLLRLLAAHLANGEDGAQRSAANTRLKHKHT